jgi:hypothetical protein
MFTCELCGKEFLFKSELDNHMQEAIERGKKIGGKFALLARILQGDMEAVESLEALVKAGLVGPGFDRTPNNN